MSIRQGSNWLTKPMPGYRLDQSHWFAQSGVKGCWLINENGGTTVSDVSDNNNTATFVGAPVWQSGSWGSQLGSFSTTKYAKSDAFAVGFGRTYPFWMGVVAVNTLTTANLWPLCAGSSSSGNTAIGFTYNFPSTGKISYFLEIGGVGPTSGANATVPCNDGLPHFVGGASYSSTDHRLYFDGAQVGNTTTSLAAVTLINQFTLGAFRSTSPNAAFGGSLIWAAIGWGAVPDFAGLWENFWSPYQTPTYRRWYAPVAAAGGGPFPRYLCGINSGFNAVSGMMRG